MSREIEFGVTLWNVGDHSYANPDAFRRIAEATETHGYDALWAGEHVVVPEELPPEYPFTSSGEVPMDVGMDTYDVFDLLSYLAGRTDEVRLGTNVCVVPYRHPVVLAKHVLTLMALTGDRFEFGVAPGWLSTEFEALDVPFEERGARTDEFLDLLGEVCAKGELAFDGKFHSFERAGFRPVPEDGQPPHTWVGGRSGAAIRRIAEYGHGWTSFWEKPEEVEEFRERIQAAWTDFDRDGKFEIAITRPVQVDPDADRSDRPLVGSADEVIDDVQAYADAGVTRLVVTTYDVDTESQLKGIERFGREVLPSF